MNKKEGKVAKSKSAIQFYKGNPRPFKILPETSKVKP